MRSMFYLYISHHGVPLSKYSITAGHQMMVNGDQGGQREEYKMTDIFF